MFQSRQRFDISSPTSRDVEKTSLGLRVNGSPEFIELCYQKSLTSLKLKFRKYPAIHTNYSLSNCTISN